MSVGMRLLNLVKGGNIQSRINSLVERTIQAIKKLHIRRHRTRPKAKGGSPRQNTSRPNHTDQGKDIAITVASSSSHPAMSNSRSSSTSCSSAHITTPRLPSTQEQSIAPSNNLNHTMYRIPQDFEANANDERIRHDNNEQEPYRIHLVIHMQGDRERTRSESCFGIMDSGSYGSLTFRKVLQELDWEDWIEPDERKMTTLSGTIASPGKIRLKWNEPNKQQEHCTTFRVLEDPEGKDRPFDFLLGRDWLNETNTLRRNSEPTQTFHSLEPEVLA